MKTWIVYIISLLLLCSSCQIEQRSLMEQKSRDFFEQKPRTISIGSDGWSTFQIVMPVYWKIADAQLNLNPINEEFDLHLAFDRGRGIEKHSLPVDFLPDDYAEDIQFSGANRIDGLAFLHFSKKDPQIIAKPSVGISRINKEAKFHEIILAYRSGNQLQVHFLAENTPFGNLQSHDLHHYYFGKAEIKDHAKYRLELNNGELQFNFGPNSKSNRNFSIHKLVHRHEKFGPGGHVAAMGTVRLQVTARYELDSKHK